MITSRPRRAFSLIDCIAAIVLISTAAPLMLVAVREATVRRASTTQEITARWLTTEKLEEVIADRHSTTRGYSWLTNANYPAEAAVTGAPSFARNVTVAETGSNLVSAGTGYKAVTVTVSWRDPRDGNRSLALKTVVTDY